MFIYCFNKQDKDELISKGYSYMREDLVDNEKAYVFLSNDKLDFALDTKKFIVSNTLSF